MEAAKAQMTNNDLYVIKDAINRVKDKGQNRFKLPLIINERMINERIKALEELKQQSDEFKEFENKRRELIVKHAEKDETGNPILYSEPEGKGKITREGYGYPKIVEKPKEYEDALKELQENYKDAIEKEVSKEKDFIETLSQPVEPNLEFNKIAFESVPELEYDELKTLMPLIE
jgi:hypothetical protein